MSGLVSTAVPMYQITDVTYHRCIISPMYHITDVSYLRCIIPPMYHIADVSHTDVRAARIRNQWTWRKRVLLISVYQALSRIPWLYIPVYRLLLLIIHWKNESKTRTRSSEGFDWSAGAILSVHCEDAFGALFPCRLPVK